MPLMDSCSGHNRSTPRNTCFLFECSKTHVMSHLPLEPSSSAQFCGIKHVRILMPTPQLEVHSALRGVEEDTNLALPVADTPGF